MFKSAVESRSRRNHRGLSNSRNHLARRNVYHRRLRMEPLEDRCLLSVAPLSVALISDAVAEAQQVRAAAAMDTIAIVYNADTMTTTGLVDLLASVSAAHNGAPIGHLGIVTHGGSGELDLGKADDLSLATLPSQAAALERLRSLLTSDARMDLYSCSVAAGADGKTFVDELSVVTGAAVFASDNPVGTVPGSDFIWEYHTGQAAASNELFSVQEIEAIPTLCLYDVAAAVKQVNPLLYYPRDITDDGVDETFCNWFVGDVLTNQGIPVPRDSTAGSYYPSYVNAGHAPWTAGSFPTYYVDTNPSQLTPSWDPGGARHPGTPKAVVQAKPYGANRMATYFNNPSNGWVVVGAASAKSYADSGQVVVATQPGHVAILVPSPETSDIQVAQAGLTCTVKRAINLCFNNTIVYYAYGSVVAPTLSVNSPNGGETWQTGSSYTVSWSISGDTNDINYQRVALSIDGGATFPSSWQTVLSAADRSLTFTPTSSQVST
ncbi:MAG: DUF4347 domain-containing protein, partial [Planctomycetes bacterium]|nr:DUF4347 domain-containing protein [Planctomycetota bacterium]